MFDWQTALSLGIVFLAATALVRRMRAWLSTQAQSQGGCTSCPSRKGDVSRIKPLPLANIEFKK